MSSYHHKTAKSKGREYNNTILLPIDEDKSVTAGPSAVINVNASAQSSQSYLYDTAGNGGAKSSSVCAVSSTYGVIEEHGPVNSFAESSRCFPRSDRSFPISWKFILILGVLATSVGVGIYLITISVETEDDHAPNHGPSAAPSMRPSERYPTQTEFYPPSVNPTSDEELQLLSDLFLEISGNASTFDFTPQGKARLWFLNDTLNVRIRTHGRVRVIQRFVLAVLYLSMKGAELPGENFAVTGENECTWRGVGCDNNFIVNQLGLGKENLTGTLPSEIGQLTNLFRLSIHSNSLTGQLPGGLWSLNSLLFLDMSKNQFTGSLPPNISSLSQLKSLLLDDNLFHGSLPEEIGDLSRLKELSMPRNRFTGALPENIWTLGSLEYFDVSQNDLNGTLSPNIMLLSNVTSLRMYQNSFSGSLPKEIGDLNELFDLYMGMNALTGFIPENLWSLPLLNRLDLTGNKLSGTLSANILSLKNVTSLLLSNNLLLGTLPQEIGNLRTLTKLYLSNNSFTGMIPESLWSLDYLQKLNVSLNHFNGTLSQMMWSLSRATMILFDQNLLIGALPDIPDDIVVPPLVKLWIHDNGFTGTLPESFIRLNNSLRECSELLISISFIVHSQSLCVTSSRTTRSFF